MSSKKRNALDKLLSEEVNPREENVDQEVPCANCGKIFIQSPHGLLCNFIMKHKPTCSYECNKALGQIK